ncbi:MAG: pyridoxamine 5'-phosphate oxidase family protein [Candidatus Paceibacterota bacterium]|jgi:uncharacterized protein YhbP (UPF0306 family)
MPKEVIDFIHSQWLSVLAVEMMDGSPHGATMHFVFNKDTSTFFLQTYNTFHKAQAILEREQSRASMVVGFNDNDRRTLQLDGTVQVLKTDTEKYIFEKLYFDKFPKKRGLAKDSKFLAFSFVPLKWHYTNWDSPGGKLVLTSEDKNK